MSSSRNKFLKKTTDDRLQKQAINRRLLSVVRRLKTEKLFLDRPYGIAGNQKIWM